MKHIQVCCRIRGGENQETPTITSYLNDESSDPKSGAGRSYEVCTPNGSFQMDYAFDSGDSQECIYDRIVQPMLLDAFAGFNCSLFSYGQTGSGKTYTLIGDAASSTAQLDNKDRGIIPRAAEQIFNKQASFDPQKTACQVKLSVLEVYQEQLKDLLGTQVSTMFNSSISTRENGAANSANSATQSGLRIREQIDGTVWVEGLTEQVVSSAPDFNRLLTAALKRRVVGSHAMNDASSRSHFCCIVNIHQVFHATGVKINSKIHFIDLAGSEMVRKTDATGVRFSEAKHINKSLSALGNVIYALSSNSNNTNPATAAGTSTSTGTGMAHSASAANLSSSQQLKHGLGGSSNSLASLSTTNTNSNNNNNNPNTAAAGGNKSHIPYRDSKLTRLLQNSLGGNAKTVIILTISDAKRHLAETLSTLRFGARARQIQIKPTLNKSVVEDQALLKKQYSKAVQENRDLQDLVAELQLEIYTLRQDPHNRSPHRNHQSQQDNNHTDDNNNESVCEICRDFLNLKLRETSPTAEGHKIKAPQQSAPTHPILRQYSTEQAQRLPPAAATSVPHDVSQSDTENEDEYSAPIEPLERCAICGLSGDEADKLQMYTGEVLGEMFSCDGNCGHQFHVRCVGLLGEGGQYSLPEGEWFCTECYSSYNSSHDGALGAGSDTDYDDSSVAGPNRNRHVDHTHGTRSSSFGIASSGAGAGRHAGSGESADALYRTLSHSDLDNTAAESMQIAPNKNPSSILATIKSEYHTMRKERNRILAQWQQEKRIIEKYEVSRRIEQQKRDQELVLAKDTIQQLEAMVTQGEAQSARMQKLFDIMLKELQQQNANFTAATSSNYSSASANTTAIRNSVDRLKWASLTVETLLDTPIERLTEDDDSLCRSSGANLSPKKLQHSASSPSQLTIAHAFGNTGVSAAALQSQAQQASGIPKPWKNNKDKVRTGAPGPGLTDSSGAGHNASDTISPKSAESPQQRRPQASNNNPAPKLLRSDSASGMTAGSPSSDLASTLPSSLSSSTASAISGEKDKHTNGAAQSQRRHSSVTTDSSQSNSPIKGDSQEYTPNKHRAVADRTDSAPRSTDLSASASRESKENHTLVSAGAQGKSKFINPLKNRLKDLLRSVEAETDAFAEIRQKFKSREDERNQLRNSQNEK